MRTYEEPQEPEFGPIQEMRDAMRSWPAALLGAAAGAFVPIESFALMHRSAPLELRHKALIAACLMYSSLSVWCWMKNALGHAWKAACWVVLLEGGMLFGDIDWLQYVALGFLVVINSSHSSSVLARRDERDKAWITSQRNESEPHVDEAPGECTAEPKWGKHTSAPELLSQPLSSGARELEVLYQRAIELVTSTGSCTVSALKRELKVGHSRAVWLAERLERDCVVGPPEVGGRRLILAANNPVARSA
jgi:hypothetical protein